MHYIIHQLHNAHLTVFLFLIEITFLTMEQSFAISMEQKRMLNDAFHSKKFNKKNSMEIIVEK